MSDIGNKGNKNKMTKMSDKTNKTPQQKRIKQLKLKLKGPGSRLGTKAHLILHKGVYGGQIDQRKFARPFNPKKSVHVIFRSRLLTGSRSLLRANRKEWVEKTLKFKARNHKVTLYGFSINSNHIHLLVKFPTVDAQRRFMKDFSGTLALKIKKKFQLNKIMKVWDGRPFSSLVRSFLKIKAYIEKNKNEATGLWSYQKRPISYLVRVLEKIESHSKEFKLQRLEKPLQLYSTS